MDIRSLFDDRTYKIWETFIKDEHLTKEQADKFALYLELLMTWNKKFNITAITTISAAIRYHLQDALRIGHVVDMHAFNSIADVGTGGGIPGIPLKIKYPHLEITLIEVSHKKITFLEEVIDKLYLADVYLYTNDWRTFLRKTDYAIQLFCARASLQPEELIRMFKPASPYKNATLVYWAAKDWQVGKKEKSFVQREEEYKVGNKKRKLVFFGLPTVML